MKIKKLIPNLLIVAFAVAFAVACAFTGSITNPVGTLWSLFPPVVAICLALITKEVYSSLFVGIVVGGLLATGFNPIHTVDTVVSDGFISAVSGSAGIFAFLVILGVIVALLNKAGGSQAFGQWASKHVKTKFGAAIVTFLFGVLIFIDDYFNCLTVGAVMRPVTDKTKISRSKLAYIIDATAAPVCMIAPISSWAAAVASYAPEGQGIALFCKAIPYNFYSILTFVFIISISAMRFDYGPMKL
ncbi:MAG: Na+/H+ antiporter NhaC family protein, partial [Clostridia bacterium]|nr:Na+/H+ antiporter NhaC family protein [Clostridia bacterium]